MYYISKAMQFIGILVIGIGFLNNFPNLLDYKLLGIGTAFFMMGFIIQKYGLS